MTVMFRHVSVLSISIPELISRILQIWFGVDGRQLVIVMACESIQNGCSVEIVIGLICIRRK